MIPNEEYFRIVRGLREKTVNGSAKWDSTENSRKKYSLRLPASKVVLHYRIPDTEPDYILLQLCKLDGTVVGEWKVYEGDADWKQAFELFQAVERQAGGWEEVVKDIDNFLQGTAVAPMRP